MRRADRLFQIVALLRRRTFVTSAQLAEHLEVSKRTIYRDVQDLSRSGVPIVGEAGVGYRLDASYQLPTMSFTPEEIEALVLGMRMVETWTDPELRSSARSVLDKVQEVVTGHAQVGLRQTALFSLSFGAGRQASAHLGTIRRAINEQRKLRLGYRDTSGKTTARLVRPLGLYFWGRTWTIAAWCELRDDFRNFRTDRIDTARLSPQRFEHTEPCTLEAYLRAMKEELRSKPR